MNPVLELGLKLALYCFAAAGVLQVAAAIFSRARNGLARRTFLRRRVTLEQVAEFAERACKTCKGTGVLHRYAGPKSQQPFPIPCSCGSRAFMKVHEADTKMLGQFRIWKLGRGPRRGPVSAREVRRAAA